MQNSRTARFPLSLVMLLAMCACKQASPFRTASTSQASAMTGYIRDSSGQPLSYASLVDQVSPAVVTIRSARRVRAAEQFPFMEDPLFQQFFGGRVPRSSGPAPMQIERALGSGVIVRADGYILTNHHVVDGAQEIKVDLNDRRTFVAKLVGSDAPSDLAVLSIRASSLPVLNSGDSEKVRVGDSSRKPARNWSDSYRRNH